MIVLPTSSRKRSMNGKENMIAIQTEKSVKTSMIIGDTITNRKRRPTSRAAITAAMMMEI